ncbi:MAG: beta-lactamase family protein [Chloroflexota bacterium]|nr:beta-lactamase family protein [Chloroflexota bacterium]
MTDQLKEELSNEELDLWLEKLGVPGASIGVWSDGSAAEWHAGVREAGHNSPVDARTAFRIGSLSKVFAATLICVLAGRGLVRLQDRIVQWLPQVNWGQPRLAREITIEDLLAHRSGLDDSPPATQVPFDATTQEYISSCGELLSLAPPRTVFSYSNTGYMLCARVIELATGRAYADALRTVLLEPLGVVDDVVVDPVIGATGHLVADGRVVTVPASLRVAVAESAIGGLSATTRGLLSVGAIQCQVPRQLHELGLDSELAPNVMLRPRIAVGDRLAGTHYGLGWVLGQRRRLSIAQHGGWLYGQEAFLRVVPERRIAVAMLANSYGGFPLFHQVLSRFNRSVFGVALREPHVPRLRSYAGAPALQGFAGSYVRRDFTAHVEATGQALCLTTIPRRGLISSFTDHPLQRVGRHLFVARHQDLPYPTYIQFSDLRQGKPQYLEMQMRSAVRSAD